jgi:hypothetical protein
LDIPKTENGRVVQFTDGKPLWEVLLEIDDIHRALLERNKKHFHQAAETPFGGRLERVFLQIWWATLDSRRKPKRLWMAIFLISMVRPWRCYLRQLIW